MNTSFTTLENLMHYTVLVAMITVLIIASVAMIVCLFALLGTIGGSIATVLVGMIVYSYNR